MLFSYDWLQEYIDKLPSPEVLADRLTMTGTEVEGVTETSLSTGVVTAEVVTVDKHPNADRLSLCEVKTDSETYHIVCGAKNMKPGDHVALALHGAVLPGGHRIKRSKIRGVASEGMMCSEVELGLADTAEGIMILSKETPIGVDVNEVIKQDIILDLSITPNRADLLSIRGIAREISAVVGGRFKDKTPVVPEEGPPIEDLVSITVEASQDCKRYSARVIEGVKIGPSPESIEKRLEALGVRSVNNVVDVTNYVLFELGQPLHAFDLDKIGDRSIIVRRSGEGESIETIDGKERKLNPGTLVIADTSVPVALAGVMGGKPTEVSDSTKNILLESAWFVPSVVRRSSKEASLSSDSSYRFERGVDIETVTKALDMAAAMIAEIAGGRVATGTIDIYPEPLTPSPIDLEIARAEKLLGIPLAEGEVKDIFSSLGITIDTKTGPSRKGVIKACPPTYRPDITEEVDLIEEVARIVGYDKIPTTLPSTGLIPGARGRLFSVRNTIKDVLVNSGFFEVVNYSFVSNDLFAVLGPALNEAVTILNPLSEDQVVMRASLLPSLLETLRKNLQHKNEEVKIFEVSTVFLGGEPDTGKLPSEKWHVSGLVYGHRWAETWNYPADRVDFYDVKGLVETILEAVGVVGEVTFSPFEDTAQRTFHPGKSAKVLISGEESGIFGETHPDLNAAFDLKYPAYIFELDIEALLAAATAEKRYSRLPKFPGSARDIAFVVDDTAPYQEILSRLKQIETKLIEKIELFDVYYGGNIPPGKRSLALRITCRAADRTLKQAEVEKVIAKVTGELTRRFGAEIRTGA